jgi:hypothetical protein
MNETERSMFDLLHRRYDNTTLLRRGNGPRWVVAEHVRNDAGFWAQRTADFMSMDLWPGQGNALHGHEVKVSRADWLCELRKPEKWLPFSEIVDYWWVVAPPDIVKLDELPTNWGLMILGNQGTLRAKRTAPRLNFHGGTSLQAHRETRALPKGFVASLMRSVAKTAERRARELHEMR